MRGRIEDRAKDVRSCELELSPQRMLRPALPFGNRCKRQQDSAVGKIGASDDILDPVEDDGAGGGPLRLSKARTWLWLAAMNNSRSSRGSARTGARLGSSSARRSFERTVFADPCSPAMAKTG